MFSDTYGPAHKYLQRCLPEALKVGDIIRIDPYDLEITHIRSAQGETEYVLSTTHYSSSSGPWRAPYACEPTTASC